MVRTQIQLTERQAAMIRRVAAIHHISMAEAIRRGIDQFLKTNLVVDPKEQRERALAAAGRFRSGHADTSAEHDDALAEAYVS